MIQVVQNNHIVHRDQKGHHHSIYSLDFQSGGSRLATGGGDGTVRVWHLDSILSPGSEATLAVLCNHTKSVNVVRWSRDGTYLASGSDDCYILIYRLEVKNQTNSSSNASIFSQNKENWLRILTLHGHQMDVLDLDWSPSGLLASASIDNTICLWNVNAAWSSTQKVLSPFRQLQKHTSFVKGVQFDPFGIYLASASADNTVIIWNCESWSVEHILTEPLRASIDRSMFRRLSWAPDGGSLCISCATKGGKNVGMVLKRDTWISVADLVGHNVQTTCCRFNPHSLRISTTDNTFNTACTVALGDQQGVISVWTTNQNSPLFVIKNIFDGPILDIAWYAQTDYSLILGACSLDGSIIVLSTSGMNATGGDRLLLPEERELHLKSIYGRGDKELSNAAPTLPLDPAVIRFSNTMSNGSHPIPSEQRIPDATMMPKSCLGSNFQQTVTRLKNGKKRIQPILSDVAPSDRDRIPVKSVPNSLPNRHFVEPALVHQHSFLCRLNFKQNSASFFAESSSASSIVKNNSSKGSGVAGGISFLENHNADSWLYLTASELIPPRPLDPVVSVVVLTRSSRSIDPSRSHHVLWETYIAGEVTSICGLDISVGTNPTGMAVVGTSLGTLVLLCLSSGIRLSSPMILGGSVIFVDLVYLNDSSTLRIVALNSTGEIWLFHYSKSCFTNTPMKFQLNLFRKTSLEPLRPFVGTNRDAELLVESCELCDRGEFIISLKSSKVMLNRGSLHFKYLHELQCWIQVGHLRSFLSSSDENCLVNDPTYTLPEIIAHSYPIPSNGSENHYFGKLILSEIEDNLISSICQGSLDASRYWINKWTLHCCQCGFESRIKLLVSLFLQDSLNNSANFPSGCLGSLSMLLLDFPKVEMLREDILPTIASSGRYQSLLVEISDAIDLLISK